MRLDHNVAEPLTLEKLLMYTGKRYEYACTNSMNTIFCADVSTTMRCESDAINPITKTTHTLRDNLVRNKLRDALPERHDAYVCVRVYVGLWCACVRMRLLSYFIRVSWVCSTTHVYISVCLTVRVCSCICVSLSVVVIRVYVYVFANTQSHT